MCFAFVDNTDIVHATTDPHKPAETLIAEAQGALDLWEGILRTTGGDLAPEKKLLVPSGSDPAQRHMDLSPA